MNHLDKSKATFKLRARASMSAQKSLTVGSSTRAKVRQILNGERFGCLRRLLSRCIVERTGRDRSRSLTSVAVH
jgi:hypothetical protein